MNLYFRLSLFKMDGTVFTTRTRKRRKIALILRGNKAQNVDLEVVYRRADGSEIGSNAGTYRTADDALAALSAFTEPGLLAYLAEVYHA